MLDDHRFARNFPLPYCTTVRPRHCTSAARLRNIVIVINAAHDGDEDDDDDDRSTTTATIVIGFVSPSSMSSPYRWRFARTAAC
jgi:hypothetical protein